MTFSPITLAGFAYGLGWATTINVVGELYLAELLAIASFPFLRTYAEIAKSEVIRYVFGGYLILLCGLVISDIMNSTPINDSLRGWANPILATLNMLFVASLIRRRPMALKSILLGIVMGKLLANGLPNPNSISSNANALKSQFVPILVPVVLVATIYLSRHRAFLSSIMFLLVGFSLLVSGARSAGLIFIVAGAVLVFGRGIAKFGWVGTIIAICVLAPFAYSGFALYVDYALGGRAGGNSSWQVLLIDNPYNPLDWIVLGRSDTVVGLIAFFDRPLLGHGSWARDVGGVYSELTADINHLQQVHYSDIIRGHSVILTAGVWGGLLGLIGIFLSTFTVVKRFPKILNSRSELRPAMLFLFIDLVWNLLFSPLGHIRTTFPLVIALVAYIEIHNHDSEVRFA
ncbi:hypothetical protein [Sulfitobacter sp. MOLA879]|uniref:hypothetical protein n=1 Tax=Sulfitobacter sp. MOLA879 TaxID=3368579 RepID=UPI0037470E35